MKWFEPFMRRSARARLWVHRWLFDRWFFDRRHFWVTSARHNTVQGAWCYECGTRRALDYKCDTERRLRQTCDPVGDYPNCIEVLEALMFVSYPLDKVTFGICDWCEEQLRSEQWV